jgi:hypothetical protein
MACLLEGIVPKRKGSTYRSRPLARLAQVEEPGVRRGEAGGGGGLGEGEVALAHE